MKQTTSLRNIVEQADQLYSVRTDIRNVEASVNLLRPVVKASFEAAWRLARARFFLGQESDSPGLASSSYREGVKAGRRAARERPERVEGHFWLGVNLALIAQHESPLKALVHALQAKRALDKAVKIDAAYHSAGPLRVMARLQHRLPKVFGGGWQQAFENYEKAISISPGNTVTRIYFAELLLERGELARARRELETVLVTPMDSDWSFEIERDQKLAREMIGNRL